MTTSVLDAPARDELKRVESADAGAPPPAHVARFDRGTRALHAVIMVTFLGLSATGMPLLFSDAPWAPLLAAMFGGFHGAGLFHRAFGATLRLNWLLKNRSRNTPSHLRISPSRYSPFQAFHAR